MPSDSEPEAQSLPETRPPARRRLWRALEAAILLGAAALFAAAVWLPVAAGSPEAAPSSLHQAVETGRAPAWLLPLDDAYILLRFAQQAARGRPWQWTDGELSTGATSVVFPLLLLPGQWLAAVTGGGLATASRWSSWMGLLSLALLGLAGARLLRALGAAEPWPLAAGLALVWSGPIAFVSLAGMESALACAALLEALACWIGAEAGRAGTAGAWRAFGWLALLPLIRPELGLVTALAALAIAAGKGPSLPRWAALPVLAPGAALAAADWLASGHAMPAGVTAKGTFTTPFMGLADRAGEYLLVLREALVPGYLGLRWQWMPGVVGVAAALTALASLLALARPNPAPATAFPWGRLRRAAPLAVAWLGTLAVAPLSAYLVWQFGRHHHPGMACAWALAFAGPALLLRPHVPSGRASKGLAALVLALPCLLLLRLPFWSAAYARSVQDLFRTHGPAVAWLETHDRDALLLVHDAGLLASTHDGPVIDYMGLGSNDLAVPYRNGLGSLFETLARRPEMPALIAASPRLMPLRPIFGVDRVPVPADATASFVHLAEFRSELLAATAQPRPSIDFGFLPDEARAHLRWQPAPWPHQPSFALVLPDAQGVPSLQGCRPLRGRLRLSVDEGWAGMALRLSPQPGHDGEVSVRAGGRSLVTAALPAVSARWLEVTAELPPGTRELELVNEGEAPPCIESLRRLP